MSKEKNSSAWSFEQKRFLLKQLIRRDFKSRYKRAALGVLWSMLSPLLFFLAQAFIASRFFLREEHYISYLITGNIVYFYFTDATLNEMFALQANGGIISKINVDKEIFLFSRSISCLINFLFTLIDMVIVIAIDRMPFNLNYVMLIYPIICMSIAYMGMGYILSVLFVYFKDIQYLWTVFTRVLMYFCALFYKIDRFSPTEQKLFYVNPVFCYIEYFREIAIYNTIPSLKLHLLCAAYAIILFIIGKLVFKFNEDKFAYYF